MPAPGQTFRSVPSAGAARAPSGSALTWGGRLSAGRGRPGSAVQTRWLLPAVTLLLIVVLSLPAVSLPQGSRLRPGVPDPLWSRPGFLLGFALLLLAVAAAAWLWWRRRPVPDEDRLLVPALTFGSGLALVVGMIDLAVRVNPISDRDIWMASAPIIATAAAVLLVTVAALDVLQLRPLPRRAWLRAAAAFCWLPVALALSILPLTIRVSGRALLMAEPLVDRPLPGGTAADGPFQQVPVDLAQDLVREQVSTAWTHPLGLTALILSVLAAAVLVTRAGARRGLPDVLLAGPLVAAAGLALMLDGLLTIFGWATVRDELSAALGVAIGSIDVTPTFGAYLSLAAVAASLVGGGIALTWSGLRTPWIPSPRTRSTIRRPRRRIAAAELSHRPAPRPMRPGAVPPRPPGPVVVPPRFGSARDGANPSSASGVFRAFPTPVTAPPPV